MSKCALLVDRNHELVGIYHSCACVWDGQKRTWPDCEGTETWEPDPETFDGKSYGFRKQTPENRKIA